jgi:hypothetical protein
MLHLREEVLDRGVPARDAERRRLVDCERADGALGRDQQRDDTSVGMADEVVSGLHDRADFGCLLLEVQALEWRIRRVAGAVDDHELEPFRERPHGLPGRGAVSDAPVNEDDARPAADRLDMKGGHTSTITG